MQTDMTSQELDLLQMRIAASPEAARPALQKQLEALMHSLAVSEERASVPQSDEDADVEALFDNMPV